MKIINEDSYMKTKKALGGLFGLFGSFAAFFDCFLPAPAPLRFNLTIQQIKTIIIS